MHVSSSGSGPDVVLLHGVPGSGATWDLVAELLSTDHRVHVPDLLGTGSSPKPRDAAALSPPAQAQALAAAIEAPTFVAVGHDYGGPVALTLAAAHPERVTGVVLASTNAFPDTPVPFPLSTLFLPLAGGLAERALFSRPSLKMMLRQGTGKDARRAPDAAAALGDGEQHAAVRTMFATALRELPAQYAPVEAALRALDVPLEIVWGDRDPFFGPEHATRIAAAARHAGTPHVIPGAGHFLPDERPEALADAVRRLTAAERGARPARAA